MIGEKRLVVSVCPKSDIAFLLVCSVHKVAQPGCFKGLNTIAVNNMQAVQAHTFESFSDPRGSARLVSSLLLTTIAAGRSKGNGNKLSVPERGETMV